MGGDMRKNEARKADYEGTIASLAAKVDKMEYECTSLKRENQAVSEIK